MKKFIIILPIVILAISMNFIPAKESLSDYTYKNKIDTQYSNETNDKKCSFCHNDILKHDVLHAPVEDDCETCHQSNGNQHPKAGLKGFALAEKTPDLCYICHESKNDKKNVHTPMKEGDCSICHSAHGSQNQNLLSKPTNSQVCAECHDFNFKEKSIIHAPIELDGCQSCHDSHQSDNSYLLIEEKTKLCITCHDNIAVQKSSEFIHAPFDDDCSNCHSPHNSKEKSLLVSSTPQLCFNCHDGIAEKIQNSKNIHRVENDEINCNSCHSPHASSFNKILIAKQETLCFNCHNNEIKIKDRVIENIEEKINTSKYKHSIMESEGCNICHDPHATNNSSLLINAFPKDEYVEATVEAFELCFNCHDSGLLTEENTNSATNFRNGNKNLHYLHINGTKGRNCNICHDMHASKNKYLIKNRVKFGNWDMPMNFILQEKGASCRTGCHTEKKYNRTIFEKFDGNTNTDDSTKTIINNTENDTIFSVINRQDTIVEYTEIIADTVIVETHELTTKNDTTIVETNINIDTVDSHIDSTEYQLSDIDDHLIIIDTSSSEIKLVEAIVDSKIDTNEIINTKNTTINLPSSEFEKLMPLRIFFKFGNTELAQNADLEISKLIDFMILYPNTIIEVCGYADCVGSQAYNIELSRKRANSIKQILTAQGILPKRIKIKAYGELNPIDSNETESGRANNRRVEFRINQK